MAGRGRAPKPPEARINTIAPARGEWQATDGIGWQHGAYPAAPAGLLKVSRDIWDDWMGSWFAAYWKTDDLPALRLMIRLVDRFERGESSAMTNLRQLMDSYGITPKGQQDRRWLPPKSDEQPQDATASSTPTTGRYDHLRLVREPAS